jgi:hypothetical protein
MVYARTLVALSFFVGACSSSNNNSATDAGTTEAGTDSGVTPDAGDDGGSPGLLGFTPSNVDLSGLDLSNVGDIVLSGPNCFIQPIADAPQWPCVALADTKKFVSKTFTLSNQTKMIVYVVKSLTVQAGTQLFAGPGLAGGGTAPFAIVATDTITIEGSIKINPGFGGGVQNTAAALQGAGPGGGGGGPGTDKKGGGGGSFCGIGGQGGVENGGGTPYPKSSAYGTADLVPLVGGSAGGISFGGGLDNGAGGGAIQLSAGTSIEVKAGGFIATPGAGGGQGGLATGQEGGGGGSGGAILLEAPSVTIAGSLTANGGGGGGAGGGDLVGDPGHDNDATPAAGGMAGGGPGGGPGGAGSAVDGVSATSNASTTAPGGGGGAGRIRINTTSGAASISGLLSPSVPSTCVTQGQLKK